MHGMIYPKLTRDDAALGDRIAANGDLPKCSRTSSRILKAVARQLVDNDKRVRNRYIHTIAGTPGLFVRIARTGKGHRHDEDTILAVNPSYVVWEFVQVDESAVMPPRERKAKAGTA
jgi:hypothetical protein